MKRFFLLFTITSLLSLASFVGYCQSSSDNSKKSPDLSSPQSTIISHLKFLGDADYNPELAGKTINYSGKDSKSASFLAIKLKQIFDGKGLFFTFSNLPENSNFFDSVSGQARFYPFKEYPQIYLEKNGQKWQYSKETAENIPLLHKSIYRFGTDRFLTLLPKAGSRKVFGIQIWQLYGLLFFVLFFVITYKLFQLLFTKIIARIFRRLISEQAAERVIKPLARPLSFFIIFLIILLLLPLLQFSAQLNHGLIIVLKVIISFYAMVIMFRMVDVLGAYMMKVAMKTENSMDDQLVPLLNKVLKIVVIITGLLFILQNLHFNITALLAGISIGGLAIALAAQDSIKNFFGSMMIFIDKPFQIGDWIITDKINGSVEEVGLRSTRIRTFQNSLISIPNGLLADQAIDNMGLRVFRRYKTTLNLSFLTPQFKIDSFIEGIKGIIKAHPTTRKDSYIVQLTDIGEYSLNILLDIYFSSPDYRSELKNRQEVLFSILKLAEVLNVKFAYPTENLVIDEFPGQKKEGTLKVETKEETKQKLNNFLNSIRNSFSQVQKQNQQNPPKLVLKEKEKQAPQIEKNIVNADKVKEPIKHTLVKDSSKIAINIESTNEILKNADVEKTSFREGKKKKEEESIPNKTIKKGKELTENEITEVANSLKIELAALKALIEVEAKLKSFLPDGKPSIVFQGHKFWKMLDKKNMNPEELAKKYPEIIYPRWTKKLIRPGEKEYDRLEKAKTIDKESAYLSTQWGMFQTSGEMFKSCGFQNVNEMVFNLYKTEKEQLDAYINYLKDHKLIDDLKEKNWESFIRKLKGQPAINNKIDQKLDAAYQKYKELATVL